MLSATAEEDNYKFEVLGDIECNQSQLVKKLYKKIEEGINTKYIGTNGIIAEKVKGRIEWDDQYDGRIPQVIIDGKIYTW